MTLYQPVVTAPTVDPATAIACSGAYTSGVVRRRLVACPSICMFSGMTNLIAWVSRSAASASASAFALASASTSSAISGALDTGCVPVFLLLHLLSHLLLGFLGPPFRILLPLGVSIVYVAPSTEDTEPL